MSKLEYALKSFQETGYLTLEEMNLTVKDLHELHLNFTYYRIWPVASKKDVLLQFCLKKVKLEASSGVIVDKKSMLQGVVADEGEEYFPLSRGGWECLEDTGEKLYKEGVLRPGLSDGERYLLTLFGQINWNVIRLEGIDVVVEGRQGRPLNRAFLEELDEALSSSWNQLKELSLQGVSLQAPYTWMTCLKQGGGLEILRLEDRDQKGHFLTALCSQVLWQHLALKELDLGRSQLVVAEYHLLSSLFDRNYCIDRLVLAALGSVELKSLHSDLMERVKQPSLQRFQQEQLTPVNKAKLVEVLMILSEEPLYLTRTEGGVLSLEQVQGEPISGEFFQNLPEIFKKYPDHLSKCWPLPLVLREALPGGETLGCYLLEKAYALDRPNYMDILLKAGADPLEEPRKTGQGSLVSRLFLGPAMLKWKQVLIDHLKRDLEEIVPNLSEVVTSYREVDQGLRDVKKHLDQLLINLLDQLDIPFLLRIFRVGFKSKQVIYETDFRLLLEAARKGVEEAPGNWASLNGLRERLEQLLTQIRETKGVIFKGYRYHKDMQRDLQDLLKKIEGELEIAYERDEADRMREKAELEKEIQRGFQDLLKKIEGELEIAYERDEADRMREKAELEAEQLEKDREQEVELAEKDREIVTKLAEQGVELVRQKEEVADIERILSIMGWWTKWQGQDFLEEEGAVGVSPAPSLERRLSK